MVCSKLQDQENKKKKNKEIEEVSKQVDPSAWVFVIDVQVMIIFETHVQITKNAKLTDASILITVYLMQTVTTKRKQKFKRNKSFNPSVDHKTITAIQENGG